MADAEEARVDENNSASSHRRASSRTDDTTEGKLKYEYLDHTADVQIHAWGDTLEEAFEQTAIAIGGYQTELSTVDVLKTERFEADGHDLISLLFHFLDEVLFLFAADPFFIAKGIKILELDRENFHIVAEGYGETFDLSKHPQGAEVKAITYSNMQIYNEADRHECFVIVDI